MRENLNYARWVRATLAEARKNNSGVVALFDSHPSEPFEALRSLIGKAFGEDPTDRYVSAFSGGNPYVVDQLAKTYQVSRDRILTTTGATSAISIIYRALLKPGDRILVESPGFDLFEVAARTVGVKVDRFERRAPDYRVDPREIEARVGLRTKLVVITNLHNPSGALLTSHDLRNLAEMAARIGVRILFDEVYLPYASGAESAASVSDAFISVSSMTKAFSLATLRCGWIVGSQAVIGSARDISDQTEFGISNLAHSVAALVLENITPFTDHCRSIVNDALPIVADYYGRWRKEGLVEGDTPRYGCISFPRLLGIPDTIAFSERFMRRTGIVVAPGEFFGAPGFVRLGHAKPVRVLHKAFDELTAELRSCRSVQGLGDT